MSEEQDGRILNELAPEFLGVMGLNTFAGYMSGSRAAMMTGHTGQSMVVAGATVKRQHTGNEREYGRFVHDIKFEHDALIVKLIRKYRDVPGYAVIRNNPLIAVIYEEVNRSRTLHMMELVPFHCVHQYFGFEYQYTDAVNRLIPGNLIPAGTVIATTPNLTPTGDFKFGIGAQTIMMTTPSVTEDGVVVSDEFLPRMVAKGYGHRTVSWGRAGVPLNLRGGNERYQPLPDVGQCVGPNGLLLATRQFMPDLAVATMSRRSLQRIISTDRRVYVPPNSKIIDIVVNRGGRDKNNLPSLMTEQLNFYHERHLDYHSQLVKTYEDLHRSLGQNLSLAPEFSAQLERSIAITEMSKKRTISPTINRQPLDDYHVTVTFEYDIVPTKGFKLTGIHGNKGVITDVWPAASMPVDKDGNRAEVIMCPQAPCRRTIPSVYYEQYLNASGQAVIKRLKEMVSGDFSTEEMFEYVMGFYKICAPFQYDEMKDGTQYRTSRQKADHIRHLLEIHGGKIRGMEEYMPPNNPVSAPFMVKKLIEQYPACYDRVTYIGRRGQKVTTVNPILIGETYLMALEKIGNTWSSVAFARTSSLGIPAQLNNNDKYGDPVRTKATRSSGESEGRLLEGMCNTDNPDDVGVTADLMDQTNSPESQREIGRTLIRAERPTDIESVIDREKVPFGHNRVVSVIRHTMICGGGEIVRRSN